MRIQSVIWAAQGLAWGACPSGKVAHPLPGKLGEGLPIVSIDLFHTVLKGT
jgi:hypothetical protein